MFKKKCRCGASEKSFKIDIGPFFVAECCIEAGFDELGNKVDNIDDGKGDDESDQGDDSDKGSEGSDEGSEGFEAPVAPKAPVQEDDIASVVDAPKAPELEGDLDKDGDVDADDVKLAIDYEKMGFKDLQEVCLEKGLEYEGVNSKAGLRELLK